MPSIKNPGSGLESGYQLEETARSSPENSQIPDDTGMSSRAYWDASIRRGHGRGTLRSLKTTR